MEQTRDESEFSPQHDKIDAGRTSESKIIHDFNDDRNSPRSPLKQSSFFLNLSQGTCEADDDFADSQVIQQKI